MPVLAVQLSLLAVIFSTVYISDRANEVLVARRIEDNAPIPGSEALLRRKLGPRGPLQSLTFKGVDRIGWDIYAAHFASGDQEWRLFVTPNGKI